METFLSIWQVCMILYVVFIVTACREVLTMKWAVLIQSVLTLFAPISLIVVIILAGRKALDKM